MASVVLVELSNCRVGRRISEADSTFAHFLADMEQFEGRFRSVLLDPTLSRYQTARLNRIFRAYQQLRPLGQLNRHIEFPIRSIDEHHEFIQMELCKAVEAVIQLGKRSIHTMSQPGWASFLEAHAAHEQAQAQIAETRKRFRSVLTPGAFRAAQAALLALDVASAAFQGIAHEHSEILNPDAYNEMGSHLPRTRRDDLPSLV